MLTENHRPVLIVIAGPNGSGHPTINALRIAQRVMEGGHDVPISKIISRYQKSILNCKCVASIVDRVYVYDRSALPLA